LGEHRCRDHDDRGDNGMPGRGSKRSFETGTKTMENLFGAKSPDKAIEVQSEYAKTAYEDYVTHARRLGELYMNLANEAFKPYEGLLRK
jgi:hypothetical protein